MYLSEPQRRLEVKQGVSVHTSTISQSLHHAGYSVKNVSISVLEQNEEDRCQYLLTVGLSFTAEQLVFVDESACNWITTHRTCAWSPVGNCARRHNYFIHGKRWVPSGSCVICCHLSALRYSILLALSLDGILHLAIQDWPYTAVEFNSFIEALLDNMNPFPQPNSVVIMDNASIRKSPELHQMIEEQFIDSSDRWFCH